MNSGKIAGIVVRYRDGDEETTRIYALSARTERDLREKWEKISYLGGSPPVWDIPYTWTHGRKLEGWLKERGCPLDSLGPFASGDFEPAEVRRKDDGSTVEKYYRYGKLHRENGPAFIERNADGSTYDGYYRDGKHHREEGPARVWRRADGWTMEEYWRDGEQTNPLGAIGGLTIRPPAPEAPKEPGAPSPQ